MMVALFIKEHFQFIVSEVSCELCKEITGVASDKHTGFSSHTELGVTTTLQKWSEKIMIDEMIRNDYLCVNLWYFSEWYGPFLIYSDSHSNLMNILVQVWHEARWFLVTMITGIFPVTAYQPERVRERNLECLGWAHTWSKPPLVQQNMSFLINGMMYHKKFLLLLVSEVHEERFLCCY